MGARLLGGRRCIEVVLDLRVCSTRRCLLYRRLGLGFLLSLVVAAAFDGGVSGEGYRSIPVKTLWLHRLLFVLLQGVDVHDGDDSDGICAGGSVRRMVIFSL